MDRPTPVLEFRGDTLNDPAVRALLREHLLTAASLSPPESVHALDDSGLRGPGVRFWSVWCNDALVGMCALKALTPAHGEIKSMRTAAAWLRWGVGDAMMRHLLAQARGMGLERLSLETGSAEPYAPARRLYARHGFAFCDPFEPYVEDPHSRFMTRLLNDGRDAR